MTNRYDQCPTQCDRGQCHCTRTKIAGQRLGLSPDLIEGLIQGKQVRGHATTGRSGGTVWKVDEQHLRDLLRGGGEG